MPVYEDTLDQVVGVLHLKDLLLKMRQGKDIVFEGTDQADRDGTWFQTDRGAAARVSGQSPADGGDYR